MFNKGFRIYFLAFVLLGCVLTQNCIPRLRSSLTGQEIEQLQTGHIEISPSTPADRYNQYNVTFKQSRFKKERLSVGLSIIFIQNYYDNSGIDFVARPSTIQASYFIALLTINIKTKWAKVHINYVASSRQQFRCNYFMVDDRSLLQPNTKIKSIRVPKLVQTTADLTVYAGISGIKIQDTSFDLKLGNARVPGKDTTILIPINVSNNKKPFQLLHISYFVYVNTGRIIINSLKASNSLFVQNSINNKIQKYQLGGMTGIKGNALNDLLKLNSPKRRLLQNVRLQDLYITAFQIVDYGILKNNQDLRPVTFIYKESPEDIQKKANCLTYNQCKQKNGVIIERGDFSCVICESNKIYDEVSQKCVCAPGYVGYVFSGKQQCVSVKQYCEGNVNYKNGTCVLQIVRIINICQFRQNYVYDPINQKCICKEGFMDIIDANNSTKCGKCPKNTVYNISTKKCDCQEGFALNGDTCRNCDVAETWNTNTKTCQCSSNAFINFNNKCVLCSANSIFNTDKKDCECLPGFIGNGYICRKTHKSITILDIRP